jgi:hypothetical protein
MPRKSETPFHKLMTVRAKLRMYVEYGDHALDGQTPQEFAAEVQECFALLMDFRNIINGMVSFDQTPQRAVLPYIEADLHENA